MVIHIGEGFPAIILGIITFFYLTDRPEKASWLTDEEKHRLIECIKAEKPFIDDTKKHAFIKILINNVFLRFALIYFTFALSLYSITFWLPQIIKNLSHNSGLHDYGLYNNDNLCPLRMRYGSFRLYFGQERCA